MIETKNKELKDEKKLSIEKSDPIKNYVEDSMQILIHKNVDKEKGEI